MSNELKFDYLEGKQTISLTTYYKSGKGVATPVEFVKSGDVLYVSTRVGSYKVKRVKNDPNAKIAPCTMRGKITGPEIQVKCRVLPKDEETIAREALKAHFSGFIRKILAKLNSLRDKEERVYLEIS
jgi:PPOX class probable F420-dependent enzyme